MRTKRPPKCDTCSIPLVANGSEAPPGCAPHASRGMCSRCLHRHDNPDVKPVRWRAEFVAEYLSIWDSGVSDDAVIAERMGVTLHSLQNMRRRLNTLDGVELPHVLRRLRPPPLCLGCDEPFGETLRHYKKGKCSRCTYRGAHPGAKPSRRQAEFIDDYMFLWDTGERDDATIARRLGMKIDSMQQARRRAIKDGHTIPLTVTAQTIYY